MSTTRLIAVPDGRLINIDQIVTAEHVGKTAFIRFAGDLEGMRFSDPDHVLFNRLWEDVKCKNS